MASAPAAPEKRSPAPPRSLFDLPSDFFDSSVLLRAHPSLAPTAAEPPEPSGQPAVPSTTQQQQLSETPGFRWTCNTCATEFDSLQEQREHFKSDLHRLNVCICPFLLSSLAHSSFIFSFVVAHLHPQLRYF
jgi:hypothetical protein